MAQRKHIAREVGGNKMGGEAGAMRNPEMTPAGQGGGKGMTKHNTIIPIVLLTGVAVFKNDAETAMNMFIVVGLIHMLRVW